VDDRITITAEVPPNTTATVRLPATEAFTVSAGHHEWTVDAEPRPTPAPVTTSTSLAAIIDDPEAYHTVIDAFTRIDPAAGDVHRRIAWVPNQPLHGAFRLVSPAVAAAVEDGLVALNATRAISDASNRLEISRSEH
jgi:alpha-L-rhamnosidase